MTDTKKWGIRRELRHPELGEFIAICTVVVEPDGSFQMSGTLLLGADFLVEDLTAAQAEWLRLKMETCARGAQELTRRPGRA